MKNISENMLKKAIFVELSEFENLVKEVNGENDSAEVEDGYVSITQETRDKLSEYFDVEITSVHADSFDTVGIWIIYKDTGRVKTLLYNALTLLIDETFEQYDDNQEWFEMIFNELGTTEEELKELGITITIEGNLLAE